MTNRTKLTRLTVFILGATLIATHANAQQVPFSRIDTNGDGVLSTEELNAALGVGPTERFLANADTDGDTAVSIAEARTAYANWRDDRRELREEVRDIRGDLREEIRDAREDLREEIRDAREDIREEVRDAREDRRDGRDDDDDFDDFDDE